MSHFDRTHISSLRLGATGSTPRAMIMKKKEKEDYDAEIDAERREREAGNCMQKGKLVESAIMGARRKHKRR